MKPFEYFLKCNQMIQDAIRPQEDPSDFLHDRGREDIAIRKLTEKEDDKNER